MFKSNNITQFFNNPGRKQLVILGSVMALVTLIVWAVVNSLSFRITSLSPNNVSGLSYLTPRLIVTFNRDVSDQGLDITVGGVPVRSSVEKNKVIINILNPLEINRSYTFVLRNVQSINHEIIKNQKITITTNSREDISDEDWVLVLDRQEAGKGDGVSNPILRYLPYYTDTYYLDSVVDNSGGVDKIALEATIFLTREDVSNRENVINTIKSEIITYISSLEGIVPSDYLVRYKIQEP